MHKIHLNLRLLEIFECVARLRHLSKAAAELHLTQPAVSMQLKLLENRVGLPLLERISGRWHLTTAGETLARHARQVAQQLRLAVEELDALRGVRSGKLDIGVLSTAKYFAPRLLAEFRQRFAEVNLHLLVGNRETLVRLLKDNQLDVAVMGRPPAELSCEAVAFAEHPLVIIADAKHPLSKRRRLKADILNEQTFLIREEGSGTRITMEEYFHDHHVTPAHTMEMSSNETIKQAVMAGMGLAFISAHTLGLEFKNKLLVSLPFPDLPLLRHWHVVRLKNKRPSPAAAQLINFLIREGPAFIAQYVK